MEIHLTMDVVRTGVFYARLAYRMRTLEDTFFPRYM